MTALQRTILPLVLGIALLASVAAAAEGQGFSDTYAKGLELYQSLDYEGALAQLDMASTVAHGNSERVKVLLMQGVVLAELGRTSEAQQDFRRALRLDPAAKLPVEVPPKVASLVEHSRPKAESPRPEMETASPVVVASRPPPERLPLPPPNVTPVTPDRPVAQPSQAAVGPRFSQPTGPSAPSSSEVSEDVWAKTSPRRLWQRHPVSTVLAGTSVAALVAGLVFGANARANSNGAAVVGPSEQPGYVTRAENNARAANISFAVSGAAIAGAVITYFLLPPPDAASR